MAIPQVVDLLPAVFRHSGNHDVGSDAGVGRADTLDDLQRGVRTIFHNEDDFVIVVILLEQLLQVRPQLDIMPLAGDEDAGAPTPPHLGGAAQSTPSKATMLQV